MVVDGRGERKMAGESPFWSSDTVTTGMLLPRVFYDPPNEFFERAHGEKLVKISLQKYATQM